MLLSAELFTKLRKDILSEKYEKGHKLTEQDVCKEYKASRTPVREALHRLEMEGLIEVIPNRGAFVLGFSDQDIRDIFQLRKFYEIQAVKWAIERITDDEMESLEEIFDFMKFYTRKNDIEKMLNINTTFHRIIYSASQNRMLSNILISYQQYTEYMKRTLVFDDDYLPTVLEEHRKIFNAFETREVRLGMKAMKEHMDKTIERQYRL